MSPLTSEKLAGLILAAFVTIVLPSFFYRSFGKSLLHTISYFSGGVIGLALIFQEPLLLAINPIIALAGIGHKQNEMKHE